MVKLYYAMTADTEFHIRNGTNVCSNNTRLVNSDYRVHPLYHNSICQWAGCEAMCHTVSQFLEHLLRHHGLNDRSTAQCRVQTQVVGYLETQLKRERERLSAMMAHLHSLPSKSLSIDSIFSLHQEFPESPPSPPRLHSRPQSASSSPNEPQTTTPAKGTITPPRDPLQRSTSNTSSSGATESLATRITESLPSSLTFSLTQPTSLNLTSPIPNLPSACLPVLNGIYDGMLPRLALPATTVTSPTQYEGTNGDCKLGRSNSAPTPGSILANAPLYQNPTVKPPFTYASLIREAIINSPVRRMSLNEIYTWFSQTFPFFRYNNSQWKNAVRHNLSLHKCFQRVEGPAGSGWTVNEDEFQLRRANRVNASRQYEEEGMMNCGGSTYMRHLQDHVNKIHTQIRAGENSSESRLQDSIVSHTGLIDTQYSWTKIPNLEHIAEKLLKNKDMLVKDEIHD